MVACKTPRECNCNDKDRDKPVEPITIGLGLGALFLLSKMRKGKGGSAEGVTTDNFSAWPPDQQGQAWYAAISTPWAAAGPYQAAKGNVAQTYRFLHGGNPDAVRVPNDANFRSLMAQGYRIAVNEDVLGGPNPLLVVYPDGFPRSGLPASWGVLRQLFTPPPGSLGTPPKGGGGGSVLPQGDSDPFAALPEPARSDARELYQSDTASLLDLEEMAKALDKAGFPEAAEAIRERREALKLSRQFEAQSRGGWFYTLRNGEALPFKLAQYYGGVRPGALKELAALNPSVAANNWAGWIGGTDILLPKAWPDPALKALPPLTQGKLPQGGSGGGGNTPPAHGGSVPTVQTPYGPYTPGAPLPPGTSAQPVPGLGQEAFPVPPSASAPGGFIWGPPWVGKWTPPKSGDIDPYKGGVLDWVDGGPGGVTPASWGQAEN